MSLLLLAALGCDSNDGTINVADSGIVDGDADADADTDTDTDADGDTDSDTDCDIGISYLDPGNGTVGVSPTPLLRAYFDDPATMDDIELSLEGPDGGVDGGVELSGGDLIATFTPGDELARDTDYTFSVTTCSDAEESSFTTVEGPLDGNILEGRVYDIDLNSVTWNSPSSTTGALLTSQLDTDHILILVEDIDDDAETIKLTGAMGYDDGGLAQYPCAEAIAFPEADWSTNPYFQAGPENTVLGAAGFELQVMDFTVSGAFSGDGGEMQNVGVVGYVDLDGLEVSGYEGCDLLALGGDSCTACPDDGEVTCAYLDVEDSSAPYESGVTVDPDIDPSSDPNCQ